MLVTVLSVPSQWIKFLPDFSQEMAAEKEQNDMSKLGKQTPLFIRVCELTHESSRGSTAPCNKLAQLGNIIPVYSRFIFLFYVAFNSQGHTAMGSLRVEEPVHTSWSRFSTVNHQASTSNYQLSNMKCRGWDKKPVSSGVEGKHSNHYTTEPPISLFVLALHLDKKKDLFC